VFLGRVEEIKGPHIAIEVAKRAGIPLVIAGNVPSEYQSWFDSNIGPHIDNRLIHYVGPVDDQQKNALLGSARAFLMPVLWEEPFGIVMAEAMACGTPVIGYRRGAVPEIVTHGETGFVVDELDEMIDAVARVGVIDREAARQRAVDCFSDNRICDAYLAVYQRILSGAYGGLAA
jgi:glycosyltransferase involved in cell wall biosynthesis